MSDRAAAAGAMPELGDALSRGDINTGHLDTAAATLGKATPEQRLQLEQGSRRWAIAATNMSNGEFRKFTDKELRAVQTADARLPARICVSAQTQRSVADSGGGCNGS